MSDARQFPIIEGEPFWETSWNPYDPFHFQDSLKAAGYHPDWVGNLVPTYRGEPTVIDLYQVATTYPNLGTTVSRPVAPVVSPVSPANQVNGAPANAIATSLSFDSTWLVLGIAAVVGIALLT